MSEEADSALAGLTARLARLEDEFAVRELFSAFCQGLDHRDEALFLSIWAERAQWQIGEDLFEGTDAIRSTWQASIDSVKRSRHIAANAMVDWKGDTATSRSELYGQGVLVDGSPTQVIVTMIDDLIRENGRWVIARRVVHLPPPL